MLEHVFVAGVFEAVHKQGESLRMASEHTVSLAAVLRFMFMSVRDATPAHHSRYEDCRCHSSHAFSYRPSQNRIPRFALQTKDPLLCTTASNVSGFDVILVWEAAFLFRFHFLRFDH